MDSSSPVLTSISEINRSSGSMFSRSSGGSSYRSSIILAESPEDHVDDYDDDDDDDDDDDQDLFAISEKKRKNEKKKGVRKSRGVDEFQECDPLVTFCAYEEVKEYMKNRMQYDNMIKIVCSMIGLQI